MNHDDRSRLRTWMLLSVLLNAFLIGGVTGGAWWWWASVGHAEGAAHAAGTSAIQGPLPQRGLRFAADGLAPAQRQAFRAGLRDVRREAADLARSSREGRTEVARLLAAPQLDRGAVEAALARTRAADLALRERVEGYVVGYAATLSPADRLTLVQGLAAQQGSFHVPIPPARP
ncbi:periplasmic heavy metal sensor [Variovorax soli]|uniref:Membrane protein n=1 Tax=Variovorax soli TaxID=376815 RepID=A0ABU1NMU5_9BURK|nr:periplasmic heavy metal sensor [Variovorax soli]MDR6539749.1 putative membrane protein [Variovorax soli]